jgi:hypothetical protein
MGLQMINKTTLLVMTTVVLEILVGCSSAQSRWQPPEYLTQEIQDEVHDAIRQFYQVSGSIEAYQDPSLLSSVIIGTLLEQSISLRAEREDMDIIDTLDIYEIRVLEYTNLEFKTVSCGLIHFKHMTIDGKILNEYDWWFKVIDVFLREDESWKLATGYDFMDIDGGLRDWAYAPEWQRNYIGDLPSIVESHFNCGMSR